MSEKTEKAKKLFLDGYNCSQAVVGAFCEELGLDFETAIALSSSFGGGMGQLREVCGAVSGIFMLAGLKYGYTNPADKEGKAGHYKLIKEMAAKFKEKNGSIICRELLNLPDNKNQAHSSGNGNNAHSKKSPCYALVEDAAEIFEEVLKNNKNLC